MVVELLIEPLSGGLPHRNLSQRIHDSAERKATLGSETTQQLPIGVQYYFYATHWGLL